MSIACATPACMRPWSPAAATARLQAAAAAVPRHSCRRAAARPAPQPHTIIPRAAAADAAGSGGFQRPLTTKEAKAKRADAQRLGRSICTLNLGQKGLTPAFIDGFRLAVAANEFVKVKVGACDESGEELLEALTAAGDCVLVHKIGFTLTFYRDPSLPPLPPYRPRKRAPAAAPAGAAAAAAGGAAAAAGGAAGAAGADDEDEEEEGPPGEDEQEIDEELARYLFENEDAYSDSDSEGEEGPEAAAWRRKPPPPEFTVIG